ncbi:MULTISPECIES: ABC transporter permease [Pseudomonas]|jgi:peptide/nickel transport system permease protein|uniref:ABC transporter permease n=1 Tax=Pseudomonas yamanorum TaxID=515393 RepID=A0AAJ3H545_9PSED|nr:MULTISPECIES: ABC transporter permease [Pseudomonas]AMW84597.1 Dipeptide transport system permease protein DppC [Pseudomonas yamanorum]MBK5411417.1 ABC transporter permease [Pseudomonas sp. TH34]MBV6663461.1 ABC transporter permease [Pseudomonas yamanorum]MDR0191675.1 ABC transporter permease [Pseudomonas yamanorum]MDY0831352.1 ABC transporter permease [Pseudomonas sp. SED1]
MTQTIETLSGIRPLRLAGLTRLRPGLLLAGVFVALLLLAAVVPQWLAPYDPLEASARLAFQAPSNVYWLGTDENGRDVLSRLIYGVRSSLFMGIAATALGLAWGTLLGLIAGLGPRWLDGALMRGIDVLLSFPDLLLALVIITFFGQGTANLILAIGIAGVPRYARLVRAQTLNVRNAGYVESAVTLGQSHLAVVLRHILPNAFKPVLILATIGVGGAITAGAALSFLGFGAPPPAPEWGGMMSIGRSFLANAPWLVAWPALIITLTVVSISAIGRELLRRSEGKPL